MPRTKKNASNKTKKGTIQHEIWTTFQHAVLHGQIKSIDAQIARLNKEKNKLGKQLKKL